jgi:hypothetical protein
MPIAKRVRRRPAPTFAKQSIALASGAWVELGASGWTETHRKWAIDPEPLIVFTAMLEDAEPRLRDEATDWCIRNWRYISKARLKNLVRIEPQPVRDAFGAFAATVGEHAGITWPYATEPRRYTVTGRSGQPQLDRPSMVWLRMRAMFGIGARTEILRYFLAQSERRSSVATIATAINYTKRNVAEECETLEHAGVLAVRPIRNRYYYSLAKKDALEEFIGAMPEIRPNWTAMLNVARELTALEEQRASSSTRTLAVKARAMIDTIEPDLDELDINPPASDVRGDDLWPAIQAIGRGTLGEWSVGRWHSTPRTSGIVNRPVRRVSTAPARS